jgi:hypothetical protein
LLTIGVEALAVEATHGTTNELTASPMLTKKAITCLRRSQKAEG